MNDMKYETELDLSFNNTMTLFINQVQEGATVLEFGPASGRLTRYLRDVKHCRVYIVEIDEEAGKVASQFAEDAIIGDILDYEWTKRFAGIAFDYILFADVLEHLLNPNPVLVEAAKLLTQKGKICLSVPNIAHNSIIIGLMNNKFTYTATGLLDNTHIHFFTKCMVDRMVADTGLYVEDRFATYTQVGKNEVEEQYTDVNEYVAAYLKTRNLGEVYQYVYVISKNPAAKNENHINPYGDYIYAQAFVDFGQGGYEEVCRFNYQYEEQTHIYELENVVNGKKLRFDPLNKTCAVKLIKAVGISGGKEEALVFDSTNACYEQDGMYVYDQEDSQLHFILKEKKYDRIVIELQYILMDTEQTELYSTIVKDKNRQIQICEEKIKGHQGRMENYMFMRAFLQKPFVRRLYELYCKKNHKEVKL